MTLTDVFAQVNGQVDFTHIRHARPICEPGYIYGAHVEIDLTNAEALRQTALKLPDTAHWFASPYKRAIDTANALLDSRSEGAPPVTLRIKNTLREQGWGEWEKQYRAHLRNDRHFKAYFDDPENVCPPGAKAESGRMLMERVGPTLNSMAVRAVQNNIADIVAVSHGGVIRAALSHAAGASFNDGLRLYNGVQPLSVTSIRATVSNGQVSAWDVREVNWRAPALIVA